MREAVRVSEKSRSTKRQYIYAFVLSYILSFLPLTICINALTTKIGIITNADTILFYGALWCCVLISGATVLLKERLDLRALAFLIIFILTYALSSLSGDNAKYMFTSITDIASNPFYITFIYTIPAFIFALYTKDANIFKRIFTVFSYAVVICSVSVYFFAHDSSATQYMSLSYNMLAHLTFLIIFPPQKRKWLHYALVMIGAFVILFGGARGATLGLVVGLAVYLIFNPGNSVRKTILLVLVSASIAFALLFLDNIVTFFQSILDSLGVESRTLDLFLNGLKEGNDITSGRLSIYKNSLLNISALGHGFYYDRVLLDGFYCHNLFLELLLNYGFLIGTPICLSVIAVILSALRSSRSAFWKLVIVMIPTGFVAMMLSGSYLSQFPAIYALLGLCLNARSEKR